MKRLQNNLDPSEGLALFTDGSCSSKDRTGGWAWVVIDALEGEVSDSDNATDTTISRMELMAWIMGLNAIYLAFGPSTIIVYSDSQYVVLGITQRWRKRRKNTDLWEMLEAEVDRHLYVEFQHVRGHSGQEWNEKADKLAGAARKKLL